MIDFPSNPVTGDTHTHNTIDWVCLDDTVGDVQWARAPVSDVTTITDQMGVTIADSVDSLTNSSIKWIYTVTNQITNNVYSAEVMAVHQNGSSPEHSIYSMLGPDIPHNVDVDINGSSLRLKINNTTADLYTYNIRQLQTAN